MAVSDMRNAGPSGWLSSRAAQCGALASLALAAVFLWWLALGPMNDAEAQRVTAAEAAGLFAVAGQITPETFGLYVLDPRRESLAVYEYVPNPRTGPRLHLRAARSVMFDLQLESYNTEPSPMEIADMVRQARRVGQPAESPRE